MLDRALEVFWTRGYAATSISDLEDAMGIKAGSIYKAFDDKHTLFLRTMDRYLDRGFEGMAGHLAASAGALEVLRRWLYHVVDMATAEPCRGCFAVNCAVELGPHDAAVRDALGAQDRRITRLVESLVDRGQRSGAIREGAPETIALQLRLLINGLQVEGKKRLLSRDAARAAVDDFLAQLRP